MPSQESGAALAERTLPALVLLAISMSCGAEDRQEFFQGSIGVGSDYTFRGVSPTLGEFAAQASVGAELPAGFYTYAWASNIDFVPASEPDDGARYEVDLGVGYSKELNDKWAIDLAFVRYLFPGTVEGVDYNFDELIARLTFAGKYAATVAHSNDIDNQGTSSVNYEVSVNVDLVSDTTLTVRYGLFDLARAYGSDYTYVESSLARQFGSTTITLSYANTSDAAESIFNPQATGSRLMLSLLYGW